MFLIARTGHISQDAINARDLGLLIGSSTWTPKGVVRGLSATDRLPGGVNPSPQGRKNRWGPERLPHLPHSAIKPHTFPLASLQRFW